MRYTIQVVAVPEDGGYSIHAINLPGCISQGNTFEESIAMITEAFTLLIKSYIVDGRDIPWGRVIYDDPVVENTVISQITINIDESKISKNQ